MSAMKSTILAYLFACIAVFAIANVTPATAQEPGAVESAEDRPSVYAEPELGQKVIIGAYINDIHGVDMKTYAYPGDIYIWFRWKNEETDPVTTFEFMNLYDPEAHIESVGYEEPEVMEADGSFYNYLRHQGAFATKMPLAKYPFDTQVLKFIVWS